MDIKIIKNKKHYLFDSLIEYRKLYKEKVLSNWRDGEEGCWIYTDDFYIFQVLKKSELNHPGYKTPRTMIRTVCGSFIVEQKTHKMLGKYGVAQNIYAFSGNYKAIYDRQKNRKLKNLHFIFASFISSGLGVVESYKKAYPKAKDLDYIKKQSNILLKKKCVREIIIKETKKQPPSFFTTAIEKVTNKKICTEKVYFIKKTARLTVDNSVKIGVSNDPKVRLKNLQTANSDKLELIGYIDGDSNKESKIQSELCKYHIRGEWFKYCKNVKKHINKLIEKDRKDVL